MPTTTFSSPFTQAFRSSVNRGTPASTTVANIARRANKTQQSIINSLRKAGQLQSQKFNGQQICWATNGQPANSSTTKTTQAQLWQAYVDWAIASGAATPQQFNSFSGSQKQFTTSARRFFNMQFSTGSTPQGRSTSRTTRRRAA